MKPSRNNCTSQAPPHSIPPFVTGEYAQSAAASHASHAANFSQAPGTGDIEDTAGLPELVDQDDDNDYIDETTRSDTSSDRTNPNVSEFEPPNPSRMDPNYYHGAKAFWCTIHGGAVGIFDNWDDAQEATSGFERSTSIHFNSWQEAYKHYCKMYKRNKCAIIQPTARPLARRLNQSVTPTLQHGLHPIVLVPPTPPPAPCTTPASPTTAAGEEDGTLRLGGARRNPFLMPDIQVPQHRQPTSNSSAPAGNTATPSPGRSLENPIVVDMPTLSHSQPASSNTTTAQQPAHGGAPETPIQFGVMNYTSTRLIEAYRQWQNANIEDVSAPTGARIHDSSSVTQVGPANCTGNQLAPLDGVPPGLITMPGFVPNWTNHPAQFNPIHDDNDTTAAQPAQAANPVPRIAESTPIRNADTPPAVQPPVPNWATRPTTPSQVQNCDQNINQPATVVSPPPRPSTPTPDAAANQLQIHGQTYATIGVQTRTVFLLSALSSPVSRTPYGPIDISSGSESGTPTSTGSSTSSVPRKWKALEEANSDLDSPGRAGSRSVPEQVGSEELPPTPPRPGQRPFRTLFPLEEPEDGHEFAPSPPGYSFFASPPAATITGAGVGSSNDIEFDHLTDYGDEELFPQICVVLAETERSYIASQDGTGNVVDETLSSQSDPV